MSLLDKYDQMQSRPIGTSTALYRDPATEQVGREANRQKEDYGFARRLLKRYARAGIPDAAVRLAELGDKAAAKGVNTRGTLGANERDANVAGRLGSMKRDIGEMENPTGVQGVGVQGAQGLGVQGVGVQGAQGLGGATPLSSRNRFTGQGTVGAGEAVKRERAEKAGYFGTSAKRKWAFGNGKADDAGNSYRADQWNNTQGLA